MDSLPGRKGKPMADSVHLGSESIDDDSIERIKAEEEELLKKLKDTDSEKKNIETSLKLRRERLINKLKYDVEDLQKSLADTKLDNDRLTKELAEQKDIVCFRLKDENKKLFQAIETRETMVKTQDEKIKSLEEKRKEQMKEMEDMEKNFNDHFHKLAEESMKLKSSNEHFEASLKKTKAENQHIKAENRQMRSYAEEMQTNATRLDQKFRKSREEIESFKQQLIQQAEDNARQKQNISEEMHRLHSDNKQLISRISELSGAKLMDNNPDIADLSDPNSAMKLGEKFSSLYDNEWKKHFQIFTEKYKIKDDEAIQQLLVNLLKTYEFCRRVGDEQMDILCNIFEHPCQNIPRALTMKSQTEKLQMTQKHHKELKDLRKKIALKQVDSISKQYLAKESEEAKKGDKKQKQILDEMRPYYEKCVEVCWPMILHDPPVRMEMKVQPGFKIDPNRYRLYGGNGDTLEYLVWPPLLVEGGGLITKGIAKPKKVPRTPKK